MGIAGIIATVWIMIGGLQYVMAGDSGNVSKGKERIKKAATGLVLLFSVYLILYTVNPELVVFRALVVKIIPEIPMENLFEPTSADAIACTAGGKLTGVNDFQDCMLKTYGQSEREVRTTDIQYKNRNYIVNSKMAADFQSALDAIDASEVDYDITTDSSGGTMNWRCNRNKANALSSHSWGTAIDINPSTNPNCPKACTDGNAATACSCVGGTQSESCESMCANNKYDLPKEVVSAFKDHGFTWGGDYKSPKDYMHFTYTKECKGG